MLKCSFNILSRVKRLSTGFGLVIGFIVLLKLVTTIKYSAIANSHTQGSSPWGGDC
jgi:hypothetical protein